MLSREDNELLVRIEPGAPMGDLLRRFWIPAALAEEVGSPDDPPVRVRLLGEDLVAFRDSEGRIGLIDAYCPHRRASLYWGRNEKCGLRCAYHGWKFDVSGNCTDLPNVEKGENIKRSIRTKSYPCQEKSGMIWTYMGPPELQPPFPPTPVFNLPAGHFHIQKIVLKGNWVQFMEGDVDSSHVSFLHNRVDEAPLGADGQASHLGAAIFQDTAPKFSVHHTAYGILGLARRKADDQHYSWRATQWLLPFSTLIAAKKGLAHTTNIRVPIDDETTMHFRLHANVDGPLTDYDRKAMEYLNLFPEMIPGTFTTKANITNDYLIDRTDQKHRSFTGIKSIPVQDYAVTQSQGPTWIADRSLEKLTTSDQVIVEVRRRLLKTVKRLMEGNEPDEAANVEGTRVRSIEIVLPRDVDALEIVKAETSSVPAWGEVAE
ncbi:Rieske 2Fe-2S domain-containing protein [Paraburkholderia sp. CNPSo 3076]|uniref:Rieske 2Fe-2S domain-containing protein n=1 Tax=Paraburkholderia sp. CNPSo 3076 TaxID=2940936 RepID=UPI0022540573|nr:Rieske 2Fe-2S domain-containing protein [Paraburkholderia sp. CNPSo 3076]MCX5542127.1 Rieske 2Fe-2S domain-containing protein [Paraburkholderia sp. CNPSo 3076]